MAQASPTELKILNRKNPEISTTAGCEELNRALDEYILRPLLLSSFWGANWQMTDASFSWAHLARQMCFKSEIVDEIARLHEEGGVGYEEMCPVPQLI